MQLPAALAPWSTYLQLFPRELAMELGPLVRRLDLAIGPLSASAQAGYGEPDGFDGLERHGVYERLLLTEWLLAEEVPDEFVRRAAMREHGFLRLARREPARARLSAAILDAGPDQLGAPRIGQLAALIVLARRADAAGCPFVWCTAQDAEDTYWEQFIRSHPLNDPETRGPSMMGVDEGGIRYFLQARSARLPAEAGVRFARTWLGSQANADDLWLLGGRRMAALATGAALLRLEDDPAEDAHRVRAVVRERGRPEREILLDLPAMPDCTRLLRDPFGTEVAEVQRAGDDRAPTSRLLFSGSKLYARAGMNHLVAYPIPGSPRDSYGAPKLYRHHHGSFLMAAGRVRKANVVIARGSSGDTVTVEMLGGRTGKIDADDYRLASGLIELPEDRSVLLPCLTMPADVPGECDKLLILDGAGVVYRLSVSAGANGVPVRQVQKVGAGLTLSQVVGGAAWVTGVPRERSHVRGYLHSGEMLDMELPGTARVAHFGFGGGIGHHQVGLVAWEGNPGHWTIVTNEADVHVQVAAGSQVWGVARSFPCGPGLAVVEKGSHQVLLQGSGWVAQLPPAGAPIRSVVSHPLNPYLAWSTTAGEVVIYSLSANAIVYRFCPVERPA